MAATRRVAGQLGVRIRDVDGAAVVTGHGFSGLREAEDVLDCGNSGTSIRVLAGLLAGRPFLSVLTGDGSLRQTPDARASSSRYGRWVQQSTGVTTARSPRSRSGAEACTARATSRRWHPRK